MTLESARHFVLSQIEAAVRADDGLAGLLLAGSLSEGRGDGWSDLDLVVFVQDDRLPAFEATWRDWVASFGRPLLAYISGVGHPWVIYEAGPESGAMPLRVDFSFLPVSAVDEVAGWPMRPVSVEAAVLYDNTGGRLAAVVRPLVSQSLAPADLGVLFEQVNGDLWYYLIRTYVKLMRDDLWLAGQDYHFVVLGNLTALLRLESAGQKPEALVGWRGQSAAAGIERWLSPARLVGLQNCRPAGPAAGDLLLAMQRAAALGQEVGAAVAAWGGWPWPERLASQVRAMLVAMR